MKFTNLHAARLRIELFRPWAAASSLPLCGLAALLLLGCSANPPPASTKRSHWDAARIATPSLEASNLLKSRGKVSCEDPDQCPAGVGMLLSSEDDGLSMCTAFLISPDVLMTNSHCVPEDLKAPYSAAQRKRLIAMFPKTSHEHAETVNIEGVLEASTLDANPEIYLEQDYAFLLLKKRSSRTPFGVSFDGVPDNLTLFSARMQPQPGKGPVGEIQVRRCMAHQATYFTPSYNHNFAAVISFSDCSVDHGNSGSPLIDDQGKVRALLQEAQVDVNPNLLSLVDGKVLPAIYGTNLACLNFPQEAGSQFIRTRPEACQLEMTRKMPQERDALVRAQKEANLRAWLAASMKSMDFFVSLFGWENFDVKGITLVRPGCIRGTLTQPAAITLPLWDASLRLTPYFQFKSSVARGGVPAILEQVGNHVKLSRAADGEVISEQDLKACEGN
ncbi:MAG: trypsin-like peptidase domain-containing protein [Methylotenera sp.]|nr:trypsin-like peptidase domain-containing protein [Oligoflexia bacterium]